MSMPKHRHSMQTDVKNANHPPLAGEDGLQHAPSISHLQRREAQAPIAACLIQAFAKTLGQAEAFEIATAAIAEDARQSGLDMAEKLGANSLEALRRVVDEVWAEGEAVTVSVLEANSRKLSFNVTRCRYAEMYQSLGLRDLGHCLSCSRDAAFANGFNPRIRLSRTQTLMEGAPHCDFRFILE